MRRATRTAPAATTGGPDDQPRAEVSSLGRTSAGRRTNLGLLGGLLLALGTGGLAFGVGTGWARWAAGAHAAAGLALLLLGPWKSVIVRRALARRPPRRGRIVGLGLAGLVAVALATGFGHSTGLLRSLGPVTAMQVHVGAALATLPLALWHVLGRPQRPHRTDLGRRGLLRAGALAGAAGLAWAAAEGLERLAGLPGGRRRFTGSYAAGSMDPAAMPVTQWLDDPVPELEAGRWRLRVRAGGRVRDWSYGELAAFSDRLRATVDCTGGWYAEQDWEGAWLDRLLPEGVSPDRLLPPPRGPGERGPVDRVPVDREAPAGGRGSVVVTSTTGYRRRFPVSQRRRLLVATRVGGRPLAPGHGFPARIVAPGRRGFWWVKWVDQIEVSADPPWWQPPFPLT
jgi:DMSO/TMAO reductase YedYZ molybdopterin-dependent catalytic subunit